MMRCRIASSSSPSFSSCSGVRRVDGVVSVMLLVAVTTFPSVGIRVVGLRVWMLFGCRVRRRGASAAPPLRSSDAEPPSRRGATSVLPVRSQLYDAVADGGADTDADVFVRQRGLLTGQDVADGAFGLARDA